MAPPMLSPVRPPTYDPVPASVTAAALWHPVIVPPCSLKPIKPPAYDPVEALTLPATSTPLTEPRLKPARPPTCAFLPLATETRLRWKFSTVAPAPITPKSPIGPGMPTAMVRFAIVWPCPSNVPVKGAEVCPTGANGAPSVARSMSFCRQ